MDIVEKEITDRKGRKFPMLGPENGVFAAFKEMVEKQVSRGMCIFVLIK